MFGRQEILSRLFAKFVVRIEPQINGLFAATTVAIASRFLSDNYEAPVMLFALLIGMGFHFLYEETTCNHGIDFSAKYILQFGVALLGLRVSIEHVLQIGWIPLALVILAVITTILIGLVLSRALKEKWQLGMLTGGAVAICGASAALAISSVLPKNEEAERNTILTVMAVTTLSTMAMVVYPLVTQFFGMSEFASGIFIGATIHDVGQVIGAGYSISDNVGDTATLVKMIRVASLVPVVLILALIFRQSGNQQAAKVKPVPLFLIGFVICVASGSLEFFPETLRLILLKISNWSIIIAISAIGMKTALNSLRQFGSYAIFLIVAESVFLASWVLVSAHFFLA